MIRIAARVQDLQRDLAAFGVYGVGDQPVPRQLPWKRKLRRLGLEPPDEVGRNAPGDDEADAAARTLRVERGHAREAIGRFLEPGVHRAHQDAILEGSEAEIERRKKVGIGDHGIAL